MAYAVAHTAEQESAEPDKLLQASIAEPKPRPFAQSIGAYSQQASYSAGLTREAWDKA